MKINAISNQSFNGKIKVNGPERLSDFFAKRLEVLKTYTYEPTDELEIELKKLANKMETNKVYATLSQKDGFAYILTDEDAEKAKEIAIKSISKEIYRQDINKPNRRYDAAHRLKYIGKVVKEAEQIGEINCSFNVTV